MTRRALAVLGIALVAACSDDPTPVGGPVPAVRELALGPADGAPPVDRSSRVVAAFGAADAESWTVRANRHAVGPLPGEVAGLAGAGAPARVLAVDGRRDQRVTIPSVLPAGAANEVRVSLLAPGTMRVRAALARGGAVAGAAGPWTYVHGSTAFETLELPIPGAPRRGADTDAVVLDLEYVSGTWWLGSVEVVHRPPAARLPAPGAPDLVTVGDGARRAFGLVAGTPLEARVAVPDGGRLSCAFAWPDETFDAAAAEGAELAITVAEGDLETESTWPVPSRRRWTHASVDLTAFGREVRVTVELRAPAGSVGALTPVEVYEPRPDPPTVLLVTSDTHRADHVAAMPRAVELRTDTLDALAARGLLYEDAFATSNITIPSHVALLTGTHPRDTGVLVNKATLAEAAPTLAERFRAGGWTTLAATSFGTLGRPATGVVQGFDRAAWPVTGHRAAAATLAALREWLPDVADRPVFCWLHLYDAHAPYTPPASYRHLYYPEGRDPFDEALGPQRFPSPAGMEGLRDIEWARAQYRSEVTYLDDQLGALLAGSRFERGVVAVTADHGEALGIKGIFWNHNGLYPDTVHVPLVLAWPGGPRERVARPVRQIDLGRTLLDLAGLGDAAFPGASLLDDGAPEEPRFALSTAARIASVTVGPWHLILTLEAHPKGQYRWIRDFERHAVELYRLDEDPGCDVNLVFQERDRAVRMRALLVDWLTSPEPTGWSGAETRDEKVLAELADLGYAGDTGPANAIELFDPDCTCEACSRLR